MHHTLEYDTRTQQFPLCGLALWIALTSAVLDVPFLLFYRLVYTPRVDAGLYSPTMTRTMNTSNCIICSLLSTATLLIVIPLLMYYIKRASDKTLSLSAKALKMMVAVVTLSAIQLVIHWIVYV